MSVYIFPKLQIQIKMQKQTQIQIKMQKQTQIQIQIQAEILISGAAKGRGAVFMCQFTASLN